MPRAKKKSTKAVGKLPRDLIALAVIAAGLFSLLSVFGLGTGSFGAAVADVVFAIFGLAGYIAPVVMIAAGWLLMISWRKQLHGGKIALLGAAICCSMIFLQLAGHDKVLESETRVADATGFFAYLVATIDYAKASHASGGAIGAVLSWPLWTFLGIIGAWIASVTVAVGALAMLTKFSLGEASRKLTDKTKTLYNERIAPRRVREEPIEMEGDDDIEEAPRESRREFHNVIVAKPRKPRKTAEPEVYDIGTGARGKLLAFDVAQENDKKKEADEPGEATFDEPSGVLLPLTEKVLEEEETAAEEPTLQPAQPAPAAAGALEPVEEDLEKFAVDATSRSAKPYRFPALSLLSRPQEPASLSGRALREQNERSALLVSTLASFGIEAQVIGASRGPALTRYELRPAAGVKVSRITGLADDIAMNMAAVGVRIEAPIPGKAAIGIEVPNIEVSTVPLREVLESEEFRGHPSRLAFALGKDIAGKPVVADLARMPHVLIAGATGSGKSVCINSLVASILYKASPEEVKLIMIDPKVVELSVYNGIPHLLVPVVTDPKKAAGALNWAVMEMTDRYKKFADTGCRDLKGYNEYAREHDLDPLAQLVVIIDELADLMMVASRDVEDAIQRLTQLARAAGIHLVIATQRPSVNVITGVIKSNIPSRIAFSTASQVDSRTILDMAGAEKLLGRGDMLYDPSGANKALRVQGCLITDKEVSMLVDAVKSQREAEYDPDLVETMERAEAQGSANTPAGMDEEEGVDDLLSQAIELAIDTGSISTSMIQRRFRVGYARAGRLIDEMEQRGLISGAEGSKPRTTLISREEFARLYGPQAQEAE